MKIYLAIIITCFTLSLVAQDHYEIQQSNTGLREILYNPLSEDKAKELFETLDLPSNLDSFKIFGTDIAPILGFTKNSEGYDMAYNISKSIANSEADHYILIFKEKPVSFEGDNNYFNYRIFIKWPATTTYDTLKSVIKESVRKELEVAINLSASTNTQFYPGNVFAEAFCIDEFIKRIKLIQAGELEISESTLLSAGFEEVPIDGITIENTTSQDAVNFDYAGLKVDGEFIRESEAEAKEELLNYFTSKSIYTDNGTFSNGGFNSAQYAFTNSTTKITVWYHYFESSSGNKLFYKSTNTISLADATNHIDSLFKDFLETLNIDTPDEPIPFHEGSNNRMVDDTCSSYKLWSAYKCALPYASNLKGMTGGTEFGYGITCGVVDGTFGLLRFIYTLNIGLEEHLSHTPMTTYWFIDGLKKVFNKENFKRYGVLDGAWQGIKEKLAADGNYFTGLYEDITFVIDYIRTNDILGQIWIELKSVFNDITFQNGTKYAGYWVGIAVFEATLTYLTAGSYQVGRISKEMLTKLKSAFKAGGLKGILNGAKTSSLATWQWTKCKVLLQGCFLAGTPILVAGPVLEGISAPTYSPIDQVQLMDYALSHETINGSFGLTADLYSQPNELNADPYTSIQQQQRDLYDIETSTWFEVTFKQVQGTSICHFALTDDWIQRQGYIEGHIFELSLPEQGIEGPFQITSIRHIQPQIQPADEDPWDAYTYKPVTALFTHQSANVLRLVFEEGDSIGVTSTHPIYSLTSNDWQLAGELEPGEKILSYSGPVTIRSKESISGSHLVYNLEVKDLHNFLVGLNGISVHNSCIDDLYTLYSGIIGDKGLTHIFWGEISNGKAVGVHFRSAIRDGKAILDGGKTPVGPPGLGIYKAKVKVWDGKNWIPKVENSGYSTFFSDDMTELQVMDAIKEATSNRIGPFIEDSNIKQVYIGLSNTNIEIKITRYKLHNNNVLSAHPNYQ